MVREHRARGIIFPDRSWHTTLGPANASFRYGCVLNRDRTNLRRDHLDGHRTRPNYSVTINRFVARITRRRPDYWRRLPNRSLRYAGFIRSSDRLGVMVDAGWSRVAVTRRGRHRRRSDL